MKDLVYGALKVNEERQHNCKGSFQDLMRMTEALQKYVYQRASLGSQAKGYNRKRLKTRFHIDTYLTELSVPLHIERLLEPFDFSRMS